MIRTAPAAMTAEDRQIAAGCERMRGQDAWSLAVWRAQGEETKARTYLESINRCRRISGAPEYAMPEPALVGVSDWLTCPVGEQLTVCEGDPLRRVA